MPIKRAPIVNNISHTIIAFFLPYVSDNGPAIKDPKAAPNYAIDTIVYRILLKIDLLLFEAQLYLARYLRNTTMLQQSLRYHTRIETQLSLKLM